MKYLYFSAPWCGPCRTLGPIMNEVATQVPVTKIDVDSDYELAQKYNVRNVPTVVLMNGESEVKRFVGVQPKNVYIQAAS
jgi:thioredoxin 1